MLQWGKKNLEIFCELHSLAMEMCKWLKGTCAFGIVLNYKLKEEKKKKKTIKKNHFPLTEVFAIKTIVAVGSILLEPK